ncbi:MAG: hypothetical protein AB7O97_04885 [Planctomycetota bacterium]
MGRDDTGHYAAPMLDGGPPWLERTLQVLDLRRRDRLLLVQPGGVALAVAVAGVVGDRGEITVLEPRRRAAEAIAKALPRAAVLAYEPSAEEHFGVFDAVLALPLAEPPLPIEVWASLTATNLRPGGRFVVDLPGSDPFPDARLAAIDANLPCAARFAIELAGPNEADLVQALIARGLRRVEPLLGTHLVRFGSPFDLAELVGRALRLDEDEQLALGEAIARRTQSTSTIETLAQRTAIAGMR